MRAAVVATPGCHSSSIRAGVQVQTRGTLRPGRQHAGAKRGAGDIAAAVNVVVVVAAREGRSPRPVHLAATVPGVSSTSLVWSEKVAIVRCDVDGVAVIFLQRHLPHCAVVRLAFRAALGMAWWWRPGAATTRVDGWV